MVNSLINPQRRTWYKINLITKTIRIHEKNSIVSSPWSSLQETEGRILIIGVLLSEIPG